MRSAIDWKTVAETLARLLLSALEGDDVLGAADAIIQQYLPDVHKEFE